MSTTATDLGDTRCPYAGGQQLGSFWPHDSMTAAAGFRHYASTTRLRR